MRVISNGEAYEDLDCGRSRGWPNRKAGIARLDTAALARLESLLTRSGGRTGLRRDKSSGSDAFRTAASAARIFATVITALVVSLFYADLAHASDTTAETSSSESTVGVVVDNGSSESSGTTTPTESATTPPSDSETTAPPPDSETTTPPPDSETTTPPPDPETTPPDSAPTDGGGDSSGSDPATGPDDTTSETPPETDPVAVLPGDLQETPSPPTAGDSPQHGIVAASGSGPFPDAVSSPGIGVIQTTLWGGASPSSSTSPLSPTGRSESQPSSSTRGGESGKTEPATRPAGAIVGGLVETFASGGGAASGASASGSGGGATALLTAFLVLFAAMFARAIRLFSLPPRQLVLIADLERPD